MKTAARPWAIAILFASGCVGTTGSDLVEFQAYAAGPADISEGMVGYEFDTSTGFHIRLTKATLHVGGVYLNRSRPIQGAQDTPCILPGVYAGQVTSGLDVDVLSPSLQPFPVLGDGTGDPALAGEIWLTGARIDALDDRTPILVFAGEASQETTVFRFGGTITIGKNRQVTSSNPATPGANPLCKTRIVTPIPVEFTPSRSGALVVRALPRIWFDGVDFAKLDKGQGDDRNFADEPLDQPASSLFLGLRLTSAYELTWMP